MREQYDFGKKSEIGKAKIRKFMKDNVLFGENRGRPYYLFYPYKHIRKMAILKTRYTK